MNSKINFNYRKNLKSDIILWSGLFGAIFAFLSSVSDVFSAFSQIYVEGLNSSTHILLFEFLEPLVRNKSFESLLIGDYMAVFFIPASILGIYHIHKILIFKNKNLFVKIFLPLGVYIYSLGSILHAKSTLVISIIVFANNTGQELSGTPYWNFVQNVFTPFGWTVVIAMLILLFLLNIYIAQGKTPYPRKMMWISPLMIQIYAAIILLLANTTLRNYLAVATWNLSMAIFFTISTIWYIQQRRRVKF